MGQYQSVPTECDLRHGGKHFLLNHTTCTQRRTKTLWMGDSHVRFLLHSWQYRLDGYTDFYPEKQKVSMRQDYVLSSHLTRCRLTERPRVQSGRLWQFELLFLLVGGVHKP